MNKSYSIMCIIAALAISPLFADSVTPSPSTEIRVQADSNQFDIAGEQFHAEGNVRISYEDTILTADSVTGNAWTGAVEAFGHVAIQDSFGNLTSDSLKYSFMAGGLSDGNLGDTFTANGNVRIERGQISLAADSIKGNQPSGDIEAMGNVSFKDPTRSLTGSSFKYNFKTDVGDAQDSAATIGLLHFRGKEIKAAPNLYEIKKAIFSTCDKEEPHYYLSAKEITIVPGKLVTAKHVTIVFLGHTLLTVPEYRLHLDKRKSDMYIPEIAYSGPLGFGAAYNLNIPAAPGTSGSLDLRISTKQLLAGGLMYDSIMNKPIFARLSYRMPYHEEDLPDVMVSRLPEIGIRYCSGEGAKDYVGEHKALVLSRKLANPFDKSDPVNKLNTVYEIGAGSFVEDPGHIRSFRADARVIAWMGGIHIDSKTLIIPTALARLSYYGLGDTYSALGVRIAIARKLGDKTYASVAYISHSIDGKTPFTFDAIDLPQELFGKVEFPVGDTLLGLGVRYDLNQKSVYDTEISVAKAFHCLTPKLTWSSKFKGITIGMGLTGI